MLKILSVPAIWWQLCEQNLLVSIEDVYIMSLNIAFINQLSSGAELSHV